MNTGKTSPASGMGNGHLIGWLLVKREGAKQTIVLKPTDEQLNVISATLHLMHDIKNSFSDI